MLNFLGWLWEFLIWNILGVLDFVDIVGDKVL